MSAIRRTYIYLTVAISLQAMAWAAVLLLRQVLLSGAGVNESTVAFQIAIIVVTLPVYVGHWLWARRLVLTEGEERRAFLRRLYLYAMLAGFLGPWIGNAVGFLEYLLATVLSMVPPPSSDHAVSFSTALYQDLPALVVLGLLWLYHRRLVTAEETATPPAGDAAALRRLYVLAFAATGWFMAAYSAIHVLRWILLQVPAWGISNLGDDLRLARELARLIVGAAVWAVAWRNAEKLRAGGMLDEQRSALRYVYLYALVGDAVVGSVVNAGLILYGVFSRLLGVPTGGDWRGPLPVVLVLGAVWAAYARIIAREGSAEAETARQAAVRRIYTYLVAAAGLAAAAVGLARLVEWLVSASWASGEIATRPPLAWSSAMLVVGLFVWSSAWQSAQRSAAEPGQVGLGERTATSRKVYAYGFLFGAGLMALWGAVTVVYQLIDGLLHVASAATLGDDVARAVALVAVGGLLWSYHIAVLRKDGQVARQARSALLSAKRVVVLDGGDGAFGRALLAALRHELPELVPEPIGLTPSAAEAMGLTGGVGADSDGALGVRDSSVVGTDEARGTGDPTVVGTDEAIGVGDPSVTDTRAAVILGAAHTTQGDAVATIADRIAGAGLIIGPWDVVQPGGQTGAVTRDIALAVAASPAAKLLVPQRTGGVVWVGVAASSVEEQVRQTVSALLQLSAGEEVGPDTSLAAIVVGFVVAFLLTVVLIYILIVGFFPFD